MTWPMKLCLYISTGLLLQIAATLDANIACADRGGPSPTKNTTLAWFALAWPILLTFATVSPGSIEYRCAAAAKVPTP